MYDSECYTARRNVDYNRRCFGRSSRDYRDALNTYRQLLRTKKSAFVSKLEDVRMSDARAFYSMLKIASAPVACSNDTLR